MLYVLQAKNAENLMVVVSRWYGMSSWLLYLSHSAGGIQLGQMRFKHITDLTTDILAKYRAHETHAAETNNNVCCIHTTNFSFL